jgi:hypothetical protein
MRAQRFFSVLSVIYGELRISGFAFAIPKFSIDYVELRFSEGCLVSHFARR